MGEYLKTPFGNFCVLFSDKGISAIRFPGNQGRPISVQNSRPPRRWEVLRWKRLLNYCFKNYFRGRAAALSNLPLDLSGHTLFERQVLRACLKVPHGKTVTYKDLAREIGIPDSARAVGNALGKNRIPIVIPCHRVVRSDRSIGGYTAGGRWKKRLLSLEKVRIDSLEGVPFV